jgi:hypothetical protein
MNIVKQITILLSQCTATQRREVFRSLRAEFGIHPLEAELHTKAEVILEAIHRAGNLTLRMIRGVIAQAAFEVEVVERLVGWEQIPIPGNHPYDFRLRDDQGELRIQVKLQRSKGGNPMLASAANKSFPKTMHVVETRYNRILWMAG